MWYAVWRKSEGTKKGKRRARTMKMQITVTITNEDESAVTKPTNATVSIPEIEEYSGLGVFDEVFERYEQGVAEARNGVVEEATEKYLSAVSKKKHSRSKMCKEEN